MYTTLHYNNVTKKLRDFFQNEKGFIEVPTQSRLSILAACEDPKTISTFNFNGTLYPLPQTGQMWLEYELLKNPTWPGVFCISTSYRNEPTLIPGRHERVFPMFEFESHGDMNALRQLEKELVEFLGFNAPVSIDYETAAQHLNTSEISSKHEEMLAQEHGPVISLERFPLRTSPFWNMKRIDNNLFAKIDVLLYGMETIGSAERSTNKDEMRECFHTISEGKYAQLLFDTFGRDRVINELEEFLALDMIPRFGAGIGLMRLIRACEQAHLLSNSYIPAYATSERVFASL